MAQMRAWRLEQHGGPDVLVERSIPLPEPGPGEVRVRLSWVGLNYAEVLSRKGLYGWAPKLPYTPGMEGAGRIEAVGPGVDRKVGDEVVVGAQFGGYAEAIVVPQAQALRAPAHLSGAELPAFPVNWMTAWASLMELGRLRPTDTVLISPAGGGVGTAAVQIAARQGCRVIALAGSDEKLERVRELGAHETINYRVDGWQTRLQEVAGQPRTGADGEARSAGVDLALEMVGGDAFKAVKTVLAPFGRIVVAGYADLDYSLWRPWSWPKAVWGMPRMSLKEMFLGSNGLLSTHLGYLIDDPAVLTQLWADLCGFVETHELRPEVGRVMPLAQIAEAHRFMESRGSYGKIVLQVEQGD